MICEFDDLKGLLGGMDDVMLIVRKVLLYVIVFVVLVELCVLNFGNCEMSWFDYLLLCIGVM